MYKDFWYTNVDAKDSKNGRIASTIQRYIIMTVAEGSFDSLSGRSQPEKVFIPSLPFKGPSLIFKGIVGRKRKDQVEKGDHPPRVMAR
jgi:hypothetical protein